MTVKDDQTTAESVRVQTALAMGGLLAALAASSCCIAPVLLFGLGLSGAWIANLTQLAPYKPFFVAATAVFIGAGYWLLHRAKKRACAKPEACARPVQSRTVTIVLIVATLLAVSAFGFDYLAPYLLS